MDTRPSEQINHLLAGLACYSLVDKVCTASQKNADIDSELLKELWLQNLKASGQFPEVVARRYRNTSAEQEHPFSSLEHSTPQVSVPATVTAASITTDKSSLIQGGQHVSLSNSVVHPRLTEVCPRRMSVHGCLGKPLPLLPTPLPPSAGAGAARAVPKISYQYRVLHVRDPSISCLCDSHFCFSDFRFSSIFSFACSHRPHIPHSL